MPQVENEIGDQQFIVLQGVDVPPQLQKQVVQRPGVDGTLTKTIGTRGSQFKLRGFADCEDLEGALNKFDQYTALKDADLQALRIDGINRHDLATPYKVDVINVTKVTALETSPIAGALNEDAGALLIVDFDLVSELVE